MHPISVPPNPAFSVAELDVNELCCSCSCKCTSGMLIENVPAQPEPICKTCAADSDVYGRCRLCPAAKVHLVDDLDSNSLCETHSGELDFSPSELQGLDSLAEYLMGR